MRTDFIISYQIKGKRTKMIRIRKTTQRVIVLHLKRFFTAMTVCLEGKCSILMNTSLVRKSSIFAERMGLESSIQLPVYYLSRVTPTNDGKFCKKISPHHREEIFFNKSKAILDLHLFTNCNSSF